MKFRADEVRFVDLSDSLVNHADLMGGVESAMNSDMPPFGPDLGAGYDDFGANGGFA